MKRINTLMVVVLCAALSSLTSCSRVEAPADERLRPVRFVLVSDDTLVRDRNFPGVSKSSRESRLSFKLAGTITSVPVQIGQRLNAGDLIAQLDAASYSLQRQQAQATLVEAQANERNAIANYERTKGLYANENASLNDLDQARAQAESVRAQVASSSKALEIARLNESYTRLVADDDCSIASIDTEVNENVSAGQQVIAVSCGDAFEVKLNLSESVIGSVDEETPVSITFGAIADTVFTGRVSEIAVSSTGNQAVFPVVIEIVEKHAALRSGLAADVTFQFDTSAEGIGIVIPVAAVMRSPTGTFVFIAKRDAGNRALVTRRAVTLGELSQSGVEVLDGLVAGDRVITAGLSVIREGQRVLIP
jgi:membrane fusion protein, multidrug efflux system